MMFFYARKKVYRSIGATAGLASEGITASKAHKAEREQQDADVSNEGDTEVEIDSDSDSNNLEVQHDHERQWDLDEAQDRLLPPSNRSSATDNERVIDPEQLAESFALRHPIPEEAHEKPVLPYPIVLPQRRPGTRARGFVRAYAPDLDAFGIDQHTFVDFVDRANESCRGCEALGLLNFASMAAIPLGSPWIGVAISVALQVAIKTAVAMDGRRKSNGFFDRANRDFFMPRGLFCLVMTWDPDIDDPCIAFDMDQAVGEAMAKGEQGRLGKIKHKFQKAHAVAAVVPEVAPLVFPALDNMDLDPETRKKHDTLRLKARRKFEFAAGYRDKRAQAKFSTTNPDKALVPGPGPEFTSRYADPNHPANEGSPVALLTGGRLTEKQILQYTAAGFAYNQGKKAYAKRKERKASQAEVAGGEQVHLETEAGPMGDGETKPKEGVSEGFSKVTNRLRKRVVYMMIVNMPSEQEMQQASEALE